VASSHGRQPPRRGCFFVFLKKELDSVVQLWYNRPHEVNAMTLTDAKILFEKRRIPYQTAQYENEAEYWKHCTAFPDTRNARSCRVIALVIPAVNGVKDIELQFNRRRGEYIFEELWFGGYSFEMFDTDPELLEADLLDLIGQMVDGKMIVVLSSDLKHRRWKSGLCFDPSDDDNVFGEPGFREALEEIERPKTFWQKLTGQRTQYDIYDWRTYRQVIK
jgi:hypothetical protein